MILQVAYLASLGGKDISDIVRRMLSEIFDGHLAQLTNWTGKNGKILFNSDAGTVNIGYNNGHIGSDRF